jgi:hypothetical protein
LPLTYKLEDLRYRCRSRRCKDSWSVFHEGENYQRRRNSAALSCLSHLEDRNPDAEVENVLDFLDDVAFLVRTGVVTRTTVWHEFYHWIRLYCQAAREHIVERRKEEPAVWEYLCWLYPRLNRLEKKKYSRTYKEELPEDKLKKFLKEELYECSDESVARSIRPTKENCMEEELTIYTGSETSDGELQIIEECFNEAFDVTIDKGIKRASEGQLPLLVTIFLGVLSSVIAAALIACIQKLFKKLPSERANNTYVEVHVRQTHSNKKVIISRNQIVIVKSSEPITDAKTYSSIEDIEEAFKNLQDDDEAEKNS